MTVWLVDKSALARLGSSLDADEWANRIRRGLVRISTVTRLEVGFSARTADDLVAIGSRPPVSSMPI
jgi:predicted nucleic acid-binding protein